jgi:tRNA threonylcarbamoyladenosine biosynthesis protein TsaB
VNDLDEMRWLILETSGRTGQVALARGLQVVVRRRLDETRHHARDLAPAVAELLRAQGWNARNVQAVVVSRGPGSYTGLRVGLMAAKAFAYATGCRLFGVDTFTAIASQAAEEIDSLTILADAQQDKVYEQRFARLSAGGAFQAVSPLVIRPITEWATALDTPRWVSGPGLYRYANRLPPQVHTVPQDRWDPQAESLLALGQMKLRNADSDDPFLLEPLYLRPSAAEEKWTSIRQ